MGIYITGDKHLNFKKMLQKLKAIDLQPEDTLVILGDSGLNYLVDKDAHSERYIQSLQCKIEKNALEANLKAILGFVPTLFIIQGNHEARACDVDGYKQKIWNGGRVWFEEEHPNFLFAVDGNIYNIDGESCLVIGGAYSVDKFYRLKMGYRWFPEEQPDKATKKYVLDQIEKVKEVDIVFSHTVPARYIPTETFLPGVDQSTVDNSTEEFLDIVATRLKYKYWFAGHYHTEKIIRSKESIFWIVYEKILYEK